MPCSLPLPCDPLPGLPPSPRLGDGPAQATAERELHHRRRRRRLVQEVPVRRLRQVHGRVASPKYAVLTLRLHKSIICSSAVHV